MDSTLAQQVIWESEQVPDSAFLYLRVHKNNIESDGTPAPGAFRNLPKTDPSAGMSTDWNKYSTPTETRGRAKTPSDNAVAKLSVIGIRAIEGQRVEHTPKNDGERNRAHTDVFGTKTPEVRIKLKRIYTWALEITSP
jgi:hypothetical protein